MIGDDPEFDKIKRKATSNIKLTGYLPDGEMKKYMQHARAFVFAAEEDFGITPVEAQACGTPVIAYGKGGSLETILGLGSHREPTGVFFTEQKIDDIKDAVTTFENKQSEIIYENCRKNAERFSVDTFKRTFSDFVDHIVENDE